MTAREQHAPACNCDYDADERGYFRCYTDPRCEAMNTGVERCQVCGEPIKVASERYPDMCESCYERHPAASNLHVADPFRGVLNRFAGGVAAGAQAEGTQGATPPAPKGESK